MINLNKFRFRIGDIVEYKGDYYRIMAYYFSGGVNNFNDLYGYTIDYPYHTGASFSFNKKGEKVSFETETVYYVREKEVNPIKETELIRTLIQFLVENKTKKSKTL